MGIPAEKHTYLRCFKKLKVSENIFHLSETLTPNYKRRCQNASSVNATALLIQKKFFS